MTHAFRRDISASERINGLGALRACKLEVGRSLEPPHAHSPTRSPLRRPAPTCNPFGLPAPLPFPRPQRGQAVEHAQRPEPAAARPDCSCASTVCRPQPIRRRVIAQEPRPRRGNYGNGRPIRRLVVDAEPRPRQGHRVTGEGHGV